jgi:hypothetical protein
VRIIDEFPHSIRAIENVWIPMPGGARLAARVWMPVAAESQPVPAILEAIPYRKRDDMRWRDEPMHRWFAGHGYATVRLDVRGSGDSDGWLADEYTEREQEDVVAVIAWMAAQPWCTGAVGMIGKSWGGFAALQAAARRPPALRAVIAVHASDDRWSGDAHYMGGRLLTENLRWGSLLLTLAAQPPDPEIAGENWRDTWRARLENIPLFPAVWMHRARDDAYWRRGSVRGVLDRIGCPVLAVGGWMDAYANTVGSLLAGMKAPCCGIVGPWAHVYPHDGVPAPAIGFLQECLRWWDRWLKGVPMEAPPALRAWMRARASGRWVASDAWPRRDVEPAKWRLVPGRLIHGEPVTLQSTPLEHVSPEATGACAGSWCGFTSEATWPGEQSRDDARSLCFDSEPLAAAIEILGAPVLRLVCAHGRMPGFVAIRLNDVAPDGTSVRVAYAIQALDSTVTEIRLNDAGYRFEEGHRLRLALSTAYWPIVWPSPERVPLRVQVADCGLALPVRRALEGSGPVVSFALPEAAASTAADSEPGVFVHDRTHDATTGEWIESIRIDADDDGESLVTLVPGAEIETGHGITERFAIRDADPLAARLDIEHRTVRRRPGWETRIDVRTSQWMTPDAWRLVAELVATENGATIVHRRWDETIPREEGTRI